MWVLAGLTALTFLFRRKIMKGLGMTTRITLAAVLLAAFSISTAQTIVIAALPGFAREFGVATTTAAWALTAFMLAAAIATPIAGRLGDLFGYRRIMVVCLGFFVVGLLLCVLANSFPLLLAGRAVTGVAAGVFPLAFGLVRRKVSPARLPGVVALLSAMFGIGGAAGMLAAGPLLDVFSPAWLFLPLLVLGAVALVLVILLPGEPGAGGRVDLAGAVLLGLTLVALLLGISEARQWGIGPAFALFVLAAMLAVAFAAVELRTHQPLVDVRLLGHRAVAMTNLATAIIGAAMFGVVTVIPLLVPQNRIAVALLPMVVTMLIATPLAPRLEGRVAVRTGAVLAIVSCIALALWHNELWQVCMVSLILGAGYGLAFAAFGTLVVEAVETRQTGEATGVNTIARTAGGALGAQLAAALVISGFGPTFWVLAGIAVAALLVTSTLPKRALATSPSPV
ncbi:MFS transporter [Nocardia sp. NPDC058499]|uniref:MFS transporter n=1 Tax=Nocardia sp. NPDC058499 TaxID=3346530 RepID=UPI00365FBAA9